MRSAGRLRHFGNRDLELALVPVVKPRCRHEEDEQAENDVDHRRHVDEGQLVVLVGPESMGITRHEIAGLERLIDPRLLPNGLAAGDGADVAGLVRRRTASAETRSMTWPVFSSRSRIKTSTG